MLSIDFQADGRVRVFAMEDGEVISITTDANKLAKLLPAGILDALRDRMAEFLDLTSGPPKLVNGPVK